MYSNEQILSTWLLYHEYIPDVNLIIYPIDYLRKINIDDYTCYVETYEEAQRFLTDLGAALRRYDLSLNHKKTTITELPLASTEQWTRKLNALPLETSYGRTDFILARAYLDCAIEIMHNNGDNAAILNYAIKTLLGKDLTKNAKEYVTQTVLSYAVLYPYLVSILDKYVFSTCCKECPTHSCIARYAVHAYKNGLATRNFEQSAYALFFAIKYSFELPDVDIQKIIDTKDCILLTLAYLYVVQYDKNEGIVLLKNYAVAIKDDVETFEEYWIFLYEVLERDDLDKDWKRLKKANVTFIKDKAEW